MRKKIGVEMGVDEGRDGVDWVDGSRNEGMGVDTAIETRLMLATTINERHQTDGGEGPHFGPEEPSSLPKQPNTPFVLFCCTNDS